MENTITIDAGGQLFKTLKTTLTQSSSYFRAKLSRWTKENEILFLDVDPEDFRIVLNFLRDSSNQIPRQNLLDYFGIEVQLVTIPEKPKVDINNFNGPEKELPNKDIGFMSLMTTGIYDMYLKEPNTITPNTLFDRSHSCLEMPIEFNKNCDINGSADVCSKLAIKFRIDSVPLDFDKFCLIDMISISTMGKTRRFNREDLRIFNCLKEYHKFDQVEKETNEYYIYIPIEQKISVGEKELNLCVKSNRDEVVEIKDLKFTCKLHYLEADEQKNLLKLEFGFCSLEWHPIIFNGYPSQKLPNKMYLNEFKIMNSSYITKSLSLYLPENITIYQLTFGYCGQILISMDQIDIERYQVEHDFDYRVSQIFTIQLLPHLNFGQCEDIIITLITDQEDMGNLPALSQFYYYRNYCDFAQGWQDCYDRITVTWVPVEDIFNHIS